MPSPPIFRPKLSKNWLLSKADQLVLRFHAMTIREAILHGESVLGRSGIQDSRWNAERILMTVLRLERVQIYGELSHQLSDSELAAYDSLLKKRAEHFPLAYIEGTQEFFGREFYVNEHVLIPRPETQEIIKAALNLALPVHPQILDLGAGSGNLAVTLALEVPTANVTALEFSASAITILRKNCASHARILRADMFRAPFLPDTFDLIVSNPPYVEAHAWQLLPAETRWEPRIALASDSLERTYDSLLQEAARILKRDRWLVFEIGFGQAERIQAVVTHYPFHMIEIRPDHQGIPRTFVLQKLSR